MPVKEVEKQPRRVLQDPELHKLLKEQFRLEKKRGYEVDFVSRGMETVHLNDEEFSYNTIHGVNFGDEITGAVKSTQGVVRLLDVGCGLGYFITDAERFAREHGFAGRFEAHGTTIAKKILSKDPDTRERLELDLLAGAKIHRAHAENLPAPDEHFMMLTDTQGALAYYDSYPQRRINVLEEYWRVLAPGGTMYLADRYKRGYLNPETLTQDGEALNEFVRRHPEAVIAKAERAELADRIQIRKPA